MPDLMFEIWKNDEDNSSQMGPVCADGDRLRRAVYPNAVRVHSFTARSDFEAFRYNNSWRGFEPWEPLDDFDERFFTEEEVAEQRAYLRERKPD